jgi:hypothetical protein
MHLSIHLRQLSRLSQLLHESHSSVLCQFCQFTNVHIFCQYVAICCYMLLCTCHIFHTLDTLGLEHDAGEYATLWWRSWTKIFRASSVTFCHMQSLYYHCVSDVFIDVLYIIYIIYIYISLYLYIILKYIKSLAHQKKRSKVTPSEVEKHVSNQHDWGGRSDLGAWQIPGVPGTSPWCWPVVDKMKTPQDPTGIIRMSCSTMFHMYLMKTHMSLWCLSLSLRSLQWLPLFETPL